jgi:FKBP-type peptidyl-prolyl cis-trans isomerase
MKRTGKETDKAGAAEDSTIPEEKLTVDGGVTKKILKEGKGDTVPDNVRVKVHYIGRLQDGTIFDESYKRKKPFEFNLGKREVILG